MAISKRVSYSTYRRKTILRPSSGNKARPALQEAKGGDIFVPSNLGDLDSPLFVDGKMTTKRQLIAEGKASPVTYAAIVLAPEPQEDTETMGGLDSPLFVDGVVTSKRELFKEELDFVKRE